MKFYHLFHTLEYLVRVLLMAITALFCSQVFSDTKLYQLDNGLKLLVKEDHRAPVVVSMLWYNVGSADEPGGHTGISHVLEHLMFKGTPANPLGVFSKKIAAIGGQENAFTNNDYTAYYEKVAAKHLPLCFQLEADRMQHLLLDPQEFTKELKVIQEERRLRTDDNPQALTYERFLAASQLSSPYHHPVIGWMSDIQQTTVADARNWYDKYYAPNHAVLVVVGDVEANKVFALAKKYFGNIPRKAEITRKAQVEPISLGPKTVQVQIPAQLPMLILGYTVPTVASHPANPKDPYTLELIAGILSIGNSGRFDKHLVREQQIASNIDANYDLYARYQTQFTFYGVPSHGHRTEDLQQAIQQELSTLQKSPVSDEELQRVKTQIIAEKTFAKDSIFGQAMELGLLETIGLGWKESDQYIPKLQAITAQDIQDAATRYFVDSLLTAANLQPLSPQKEKSS